MSANPKENRRIFRVTFDLPEESPAWPPVRYERLWAEKTDTKLHLSLRNTPLYCKGVAFGDIIAVRLDDGRREIVFDKFVAESGHSAVQIIVKPPSSRSVLDRMLLSFDATWETMSSAAYYAVDIRPDTDYAALRSELTAAEARRDIEFQESAISRCHQAQLLSFPPTSADGGRNVS
ncbi:DUF4265 domain-containing protein [Actinokineospora enzanensis]|uniref:DUF4265 domain-containing protein n=1 Tax=Actinokineospora enzanensis TaxID=155975 RepID=UPI0009FBC224|nr:DUF4265 domain-containing protein [Actinokineospora enzanensis]